MGYPTGQWIIPVHGVRWWFDSGSLALDFVYTGDAADPQGATWQTRDRLDDLAIWFQERFPDVDPPSDDREIRDTLTLRDALARLSRSASRGAVLAPAAIDTVNLFAAIPDIPPQLAGGSRQVGRARPRFRQALGTLARGAIVLFSPDVVDRVRECSADECHFLYLDTSRSRNRRWCSMQRCGNRAKVRAHRERTLLDPA